MQFLFVIILFAGLSFGISRFFKTFKKKANDKQLKQDVEQMRLAIAQRTDELVPWSTEEMELLSLEHVEERLKRGNVANKAGFLTSIYQEPMIAYNYKKYGSKYNSVVYAKTSDREFVYRIRDKGIQIYLDNQPLGILQTNGVLYDPKKKMIARMNHQKEELLNPILVKNREVGNLVNPAITEKMNPRAFDLLSPMESEEEDIFLSLAVLQLVLNAVEK